MKMHIEVSEKTGMIILGVVATGLAILFGAMVMYGDFGSIYIAF